jgi:diguanylate cyclase (GGDEF)-like protein
MFLDHGVEPDGPEPDLADAADRGAIDRRLPDPVPTAETDEALVRLREHQRRLRQSLRTAFPIAPFVIAFPTLVLVMLPDDVDRHRAAGWIAVSIVAALTGAAAQWRRRDRTESEAFDDRRWRAVLIASLVLGGATFGLGTWVTGRSAFDAAVLVLLFPTAAGAIGAQVFAGRFTLFVAFEGSMFTVTIIGLLSRPETRAHALAGIACFYVLALLVLQHVVGRSLLAALEVQHRSDELLTILAGERATLHELNDRLAASNAQLEHLALHDPLTGLFNRRGALDRLDQMLAGGRQVALLFCDLDRFKAVNDALGHRGGDQFLVVIADRLQRSIDHRSIAGRIGGDEFVVALADHDLAMGAAVANRIVGVLGQPVHAEGREIPSSVSIGVAASPDHATTSTDLVRHANAALYRAKGSGRNRVELFDLDAQAEHDAAMDAAHGLRRALDLGEIVVFFQPEMDASNGRVVGAELLARWLHPDGTVVNAGDFIGLAGRAGLLERLTERVLGQARPHIRRLASFGLPEGFRFRINLGPQSTDRSWRDNPIESLVRGIDPSLLTVDVRESAVSSDLPAAAGTLAQFRARGGRVCLDDFTRGVSSLSLLRRLPVDEVRIDRHAIDTIATHPHDRAIVRSIISVVREIGLSVTAEGVETGAHADALIALGCVRQQGHLYAAALPVAEFEAFLAERMAADYVTAENSSGEWDAGELDGGN